VPKVNCALVGGLALFYLQKLLRPLHQFSQAQHFKAGKLFDVREEILSVAIFCGETICGCVLNGRSMHQVERMNNPVGLRPNQVMFSVFYDYTNFAKWMHNEDAVSDRPLVIHEII
jgi:hypothetical protein